MKYARYHLAFLEKLTFLKKLILALFSKSEPIMGWEKRVSKRSYILRYFFSLLAVALAFLTKVSLFPLITVDNAPFLTFFGAIVFSAWYGGLGPGILATIISALVGDYFFLNPIHTILLTNSPAHNILVGIFIIEGMIISLFSEVFHSELRKTDLINREMKELSSVVEQTADGVVITDRHGMIEYINPAFEQITEYSMKDAVGNTPRILKSGKHSKNFYKGLWTTILAGQVFRSRMANRKKSGKIYYADLTITPIKNKKGQVTHFVGTWKDITRHIQAEEALQQREKQYRLLFEKNPYPMWVLDGRNNAFLAVNEAAVLSYGYSKEEFLKLNLTDLYLSHNIPKLKKIGSDLGSAGVWQHRKKDGSVIDVEITRSTIRFKNKIARLILADDITDRIKEEERKDEFISIAGHELRTPITSLKALTQILKERNETASNFETVSYLTKMDGQLNKLTRLIRELLDVSKIQAGHLELQRNEYDLIQLIREVIGDLQGSTKKHLIIVKGLVKKNVFVDRYRINQVLINLILNAIKYSPEADKMVVRISSDKNNAVVSIQDFGIGINKADQGKIFERFYRVNGPNGERFSGLGLGLYISSEIIKKHGGKIWVQSELGKGSIFTFTVPFQKKKRLISTDKINEEANTLSL